MLIQHIEDIRPCVEFTGHTWSSRLFSPAIHRGPRTTPPPNPLTIPMMTTPTKSNNFRLACNAPDTAPKMTKQGGGHRKSGSDAHKKHQQTTGQRIPGL